MRVLASIQLEQLVRMPVQLEQLDFTLELLPLTDSKVTAGLESLRSYGGPIRRSRVTERDQQIVVSTLLVHGKLIEFPNDCIFQPRDAYHIVSPEYVADEADVAADMEQWINDQGGWWQPSAEEWEGHRKALKGLFPPTLLLKAISRQEIIHVDGVLFSRGHARKMVLRNEWPR